MRMVLAAAAAFGLACPSAARAQIAVRPKLAFAGGVTFPVAPSSFNDGWGPWLALSGGLQLASLSRLQLGIEAGYYRHRFDAAKFESSISSDFPDVNVSGNALYVIPVTLASELALLPFASTRPYVRFGAGFYHAGTTTPARSGPASDNVQLPHIEGNAVGASAGLGVRTTLTPTATLFLDATYHIAWIDPDPIHFVPLRLGVRF